MNQARINTNKVSIVIRSMPGRIGALRAALDSVSQQSYKDVQVVVAFDDGENAPALRGSLEYPFELDIILCPKVGRSRAGNLALERCRGDFIGFLDDDDMLYPDHIQMLVSALQEDRSAQGAYAVAHEIPAEIASYSPFQVREKKPFVRFRGPFTREDIWIRSVFPIQSVLFHRQLYEECGGFDESLDMLEDWELWIRYSHRGVFMFVPMITSAYRVPVAFIPAFARLRSMASHIAEVRKRQNTLMLDVDSPTVTGLVHARLQSFTFCRLLTRTGILKSRSLIQENKVAAFSASFEGRRDSIGSLISSLNAAEFLRPGCRILVSFETLVRRLLLGRALS